MSLRKVNILMILLAAVVFLIVLHHNLTGVSDLLSKESSDSLGGQLLDNFHSHGGDPSERTGEEIAIVMPAVEERLGGVIAAMNSIYSNSKSNVIFYLVTINTTVGHLRSWLQIEELKRIKHRIIEFNPSVLDGKIPIGDEIKLKPLMFARYYLPTLVPGLEKAIYLDDDVIIQGDILELYQTELNVGYAAAFSEDCDSVSSKVMARGTGSQNTYLGFLDYKKETIRKLGIKAGTCSFNPGVFVANLTEWRQQNITRQLEKWMEINVAETVYHGALVGASATPPLLIVFYKRHASIAPLWHIRHLGSNIGTRYSPYFVRDAKLLHWNGRFKPWGRVSTYSDIWDKWYIPDPTGKFYPLRRHPADNKDPVSDQ